MTISLARLLTSNSQTGTTITDDPTLQLALAASTRYRIVDLSEMYANDTVDWKRKTYYTNGGTVSNGPYGYFYCRGAAGSLATSVITYGGAIGTPYLNDEYEQNGSNTTSHRTFVMADFMMTTNAAGDLRIARSPRFSGAGNVTTHPGSCLIAIPFDDMPFNPDRGDLVAYKSGDQTIAVDAANTTVTDMALPLAANRDYFIEAIVHVKADAANAAAAGYGLAWGYSGTYDVALMMARMTDMAAFDQELSSTLNNVFMWSNGSSSMGTFRSVAAGAASTFSQVRVLGLVRGTSAGDFTATIDPSGTAGDDIIVGAGSCMIATALN
jgi:hypothetical protein